MHESALNDDFRELLQAFVDHEVDFMVVGAHAMSVHGVIRATGDLDVWVRPERANAKRVVQALREFGAPLEDLRVASVEGFEIRRIERQKLRGVGPLGCDPVVTAPTLALGRGNTFFSGQPRCGVGGLASHRCRGF